jgi:hypothetical protein
VIVGQALQRPTGDTEALYRSLASLPVGTSTLETQLATTGPGTQELPPETAVTQLRQLTDAIPRLHVAVRGPLDDPTKLSGPLLVGVAEEGIQDDQPHTFTAYDAQGVAHQIDDQAPLTQPLLVVGVNERTDDQGQLLPGLIRLDQAPTALPAAPMLSAQEGECGSRRKVWETIYKLYMRNDHEPNSRGDAELAFQIKAQRVGSPYGGTVIDANNDKRWYTVDRQVFWWTGATIGNWIIYEWYEVDGGASVTVTVEASFRGQGVNASFTLKDGDDQMGHALVDVSQRYKYTQHDTGDIVWQRSSCDSPL